MRAYLSILAFLASVLIMIILFPMLAAADVVSLKSGQTYTGIITSEEDDRVQIKLQETGTRIWFMRDQVASIEKTAAKEEPKQKDDSNQPAANSENTSASTDDVSRARELLKKMREQQSEESANKKKNDRLPPSPAASEQETVVVPPAANGSEIEKLIDTMRNGKYYDRLSAIKKLGDLKAKEAIPHLIHYLDDEDYSIRQEANRSLIKITEKNDIKFNPRDRGSVRAEAIEKWKNWYDEEKKKESSSRLKFFW